ncbi:VCBS domain-containing protein [Vibrio breoganii]
MSDKSKQNKDSKSVIKNTDTKAVQKDLSAKADASKRAVKKERETKKKQIYIPLGSTLSLVLPSFRKADATETDPSSAIAPLESHSKISAPTVHHATETEHSASATSLVQQNIITTADEKDSNSIHSQAHSSNYSHHPVISHPFMNVGYEVANTHASELQGYQTASPQQPTESTVTYREETLTGKYGTLTVGPDGHYAYNLNPKSPAFILLQGHELGTDSFVIHLSNGLQQTVAVPITGNNEAAQFSGDLAGAVTEDLNVNSNGLITTQGTLAVSDQDHDQDSLVAVHNQATKYGEFSIDESGHWQYQVNNAGNTVQALSSGQMLQETITVHSVDGTEQQIVVTINGQDDTAVISGNDLGSVVEDKQPQVSGKLDVTDPDASQQHFQGGDLVGTLGTLHLQDNGAWTYDLDNTNPKVQALGQAATATDTITVQSADGTTHKVTITVNGTNDKAVIAGTDSGAVTEESQLQTSGTLTVTDVDTGEAHFSNTDIVGTLGTLHLKDNGAWSYDLDNTNPTVQALGQGKTATDTITVQSADGTTHKVTITVNGINDKAVIAGTDSGAVTEESQLQASGTLTVTDVDTGEAHFSNTDIAGNLGTLHLTDSGAWTYDLDNTNPTVQALGKGATATDTITVHSTDGTPHQVKITINGTNDKAVIAGTDSGAVTEESQLQTSGTLTATDVDTGEAHFSNTDVVGTLGTLHLKDNGAWTYDLDNTNPKVQALGNGATATDTLTVHSADGTPHQVKITVNGTNDKAVIAGSDSGAVTEESQLQTSGTLTVTDVDTGEAHFSNTDIAGTLGTLHLKDNGAWTYNLDNTNSKVQALGKGATATDIITVQSADGTTHKVTITVNGTNDTAVIGGTNSGAVTEESQLQTSGTLTVTDVDTGEAHFSNTDIAGNLGTLHLTDSGAWTYDLDNTNPTVQALGKGATATDTITVHSADGTPHQVTITVNGTNDAAVIMGTSTGDVHEGHTFTAPDGSMTGGYVDDRSPDHMHGNIGKLWNDEIHTDGHLSIVDADAGESYAQTGVYYGSHGRVILQTNGDWSYFASIGQDATGRAIDHLGKGESLTDTVTVKSADGTTHDIVITIHGDNDRPYCSGEVQLNSGKEDLAQTITATELIANTVDVDANDAGKLTIANLHADHGSIQDNHDGTFTFTPSHNYNGSVHFTYDVKDAHGGTTHTGASTTLSAVGDKAQIAGVDTGSITENSAGVDMSPDYAHSGIATLGNTTLYADGKLTITDPDVGESGFERQGSNGYDYHGTYGDLILLTDGTWHYHADAGHLSGIGARPTTRGTAIDQLGEGQSLTDTITVHSKDGTTHDIVITIHGSNDRPYCSSEVVLANGSEDTRQTLTTAQLLANTVDVDANDAGKLTIENLHADHGSILNNADGTFTFTPEKDYNGAVHFSYDVKDAHGGVTHTGATTNLAAVNDNPDVTPLTDSVSEGADNHHTLNLLVGATDKDGDALSVSHLEYAIDGQLQAGKIPAGITLDTDGHTLIVDATDPAFNHLANGQSQQIAITYQVEDGHGGSTQQTATLTIAGTDDKATLVSNVIQLTETQALDSEFKSYRGQLQLIDPDSGDNTQFVFSGKYLGQGFEPGHLDVWPNGTYQFRLDAGTNRHADDLIGSLHAGESMELPYEVETTDGQKLTIMVKVTGEDNQAKIAVTPYSSLNNHVYEDHTSFGNTTNQLSSGGTLQVIDPDHDQAGFIAQTITTAEGGRFNINAQGHWSYDIDNDKVQRLGAGESFQQTFTVESIDGSAKKDITVTVHGTNDAPVASSEVRLANGLEDNKIVLTPAQLLANTSDVDDNDIGKLSIENLQADHGAIALNADGTFTFTPEKDYNGDVHFSYDVKDAHGGVTHTGASTTLSAVADKAQIAGVDTGSITENSAGVDMSPDYAHSGIATLGNTTLYADGKLTITDPDVGESGFERQGSNGYDYHGTYGDLILLTDGTWHYHADAGHLSGIGARPTTHGTVIDQLGEGQSLTDTITVHSKDGTTHDIVITIHGSNDRPYCSSEVVLANGSEDTRQNLTTTQLLANTVDVDKNDAGKLTIENLHADHGSILNNADGTFIFTPEKDYNGDVHFSYDVKDAHGGVTHTGASTSLAAVDDKTIINGVDHGVATEDVATHMSTNVNIMDAVDWQALQITDVDSSNQQVTVEFAGKQYTWDLGSNLDVTTPYGKFQFYTITNGPHTGEHCWSYIGDNSNVHVQELKHGESFTESIKLIATDGTEFPITVKVNGSEDGVVIDSKSELGHVVENAQTGASVSGSAIAHDVDLHDTVSWTQTPTTGLNGQYGTFHLSADGQWHYDVDQNKATKLGDGDEYWEHFTVEAVSTDGSHVSKSVSVVVHGNNDAPIVVRGEVTLPSGKEDTSIHITQAQLVANAIDVDVNDRGWLHVENLTADHGSLVSNSDGSFTFNPDPNYNGTVHFSYDIADRHGGIAHTGAITTLAAVNDAATFAGDSSSIKEDTNIHHNAHITGSATIPDALYCHGHLIVSDADGHGEAALDLKGQPKISLDGTYGHFDITSTGTWVYKADNKSTPIQDLDNGQTLTDSIEVTSKDGTKHSITVTINGTTDDPVLHSLSDSGVQHSGPVEGNLLTGSGTDQGLSGAATDTDSNAHLVLQDIQIKDPVSGYVAVRPGQPHTMAGIGTLAIEANGHYTFTPEAGFTGKVPSMVYRVGDDGGNPIGDSSQNSLSIEVTPPLQHAPTVTGQTVSTNEDITRTFTTSEFGYSDQDGDALQFVTISSIPSHGLLLLNGNAVTANQQISKADLDAGHLTFTPNNNENGANYAQFTFTANDGHKNSAGATMVVDVNAVNDAPIVGSSFISSLEDKPHAFTTADFKYSDIDGDALNHITITNVAHGVLSLNGTTVNVGDNVSASDVSSLIFTPTHNYFSSGVSGLGAVQFTANDGHLDSKEGSILINIASVADPATFSGDSTGVAKEDITLQASGTLTASDPDGTAGFTAVQGGAGIAGSKGYGHAHIDVNGHWTYDLDNNHPIVQQLGEGQTDTETITVQSADGTHHDIVVTITGTNDAPILGVNQTSSTAGTLTETDVDVNDTHTFSIVSSTGQFGSLSVDPNTGDYVYTPNTSITGMSYNSATNSYHGVDVFEVKVSDGHTEDSKFITFDASGHVTMSPTGGLVISTTVPQQPTVTTTLPTMLMVTNVATTNSVTLDLASTSDSGSSNTDNLTNDTTPTITGHTDIPFSKVTVYDGSTPVGHAVSDASGQYSVVVSSLSEGDHNLSAKALAPSSVVPATSSLLSVHIDTQVHVGIQTDPITADNVINAQESNSSIDITGSVSGDYNAGDIVTLDVNGTQHTGAVDAKGHYSIAVPGSELIADADQKIEASIAVTDTAGNSAHATTDVTYQVDTQVSVPTITFENAGADNLYSKAEIARGQANTITATVTPPGDAKIGEHLVVNGQDHVLDAHSLQHGIQIEVHPGSNVQATMTDEHGNTAGSQGFAASAIPEPIIVRPPSGSHQVSGTLGVPPLLPSLTPVPTAQSGWRIHLPNGQYVTSHHGQYGTLTIDPQTGHLHYQEQAQVHTGPHGSASGIGQHEDKFEVALQGTNQDQVVAHVNIQILSHGPGNSGKLTVGTEVVDMTITPIVHTSHPAPPPQSDESHSSPETIEVTLYADDDNTHHDLMAGLSALADDHSSSGSNPYTDIVGLHDAPQADDSAMPTPEPAPDLDLLLNQADDLAHQHPVDAFIDNNGEEHKADDQHVLDEEHIQHDLPDVMDLPDHHH